MQKIIHPSLFDDSRPCLESDVYVGDLEYPFRGMLMSHMASPDLEELHKMAALIGIKRKWFQNDENYPHYDICKSKKALAIKHGTIEISDGELIKRCYPNLKLFNQEF